MDLGGGPRDDKLQNAVAYYFHDYPAQGHVTKVISAKFTGELNDAYRRIEDFTGKDVRATEAKDAAFPTLLEPVDDLPPATMITSIQTAKGRLVVRGVSHDNGDIASVTVNDRAAKIISSHAGVADWEISLKLDKTSRKRLVAQAVDCAGNTEKTGHWVETVTGSP